MVVPQAEDPSTMMEESGSRLFQNDLFLMQSSSKAFTGNFKEASTSEVIIEGHATQAVYGVLHYLYTGTVAQEDFTTVRSALDLFIAADYFNIAYARDEAVEIFGIQLRYLSRLNHSSGLENELLPTEDRDSFFLAARFAYTSVPNFEVLRPPIERLIQQTDFLLTKDTRFMQELKSIPEFAVVIIEMMTSRVANDAISRWPAIPQSCHGCGRGETKFADIWVASVRDMPGRYSKHHLKLRGNCDDCTAALGDKRSTKP
ncbi:hypothetical protein PG997_010884 [Apiospora hydei]|uniref:BTB domain-containing protein n=1 Tax=Apiospora hydei TaxID=1337664 RepID=A0ABR1VHH6_9PEZI